MTMTMAEHPVWIAIRRFLLSRGGLIALLAAGLLLRVALVDLSPWKSELHQVAVTLARTGVIANPYRIDGIPTTHVGPISPLPAAIAYRLLGVDTVAAESVLFVLAMATMVGTLLLLDRAFALLGSTPLARRGAMAVFLLVPIYYELETQDLRVRETGMSAMILAFVLLRLLQLDRRGTTGWRDLIGLAALMAFLFLFSPAAALAGYAACGVFTLRNVRPVRWPVVAAVVVGALALASAPWAARNHAVTGQWVWSRGNAGLELAVGTFPAAVDPVDHPAVFRQRLKDIHPFQSDDAYRRMIAQGGEVPYARRLGAETWAWARAHPAGAARIWVRHVYEYYLTPNWLWSPYGIHLPLQKGRYAIGLLISLFALGGLGWFVWRRRWLWLYPASMIAVSVVPYVVAQPRTRYRYVIAGMLLFVAAEAAVALLTGATAWWQARRTA